MDHLLEILSRIRADVPSVRLVVAGDGPLEASLRAQATQLGLDASVTWLGRVARERLVSWMEASDAFVLLSEYEGFPHVAIEAMASGLPVALSGAGGNPALVTDGHDGLLLDPGHHAGSAAALVRLLTDEPWRRTLAERARNRAADFSWLTLMKQTLDVLRRGGRPTEGQARLIMEGTRPVRSTVVHVQKFAGISGSEGHLRQLLTTLDRSRITPVLLMLSDGSDPRERAYADCASSRGSPASIGSRSVHTSTRC